MAPAQRIRGLCVVAAVTVAGALGLAAGPAAAKSPAEIAATTAAGVVSIASTFTVQSRFGTEQEAVGTGSGLVIDRAGHILTSEHLIEGAQKVHVSFADGTKVHATVVGSDPLLDLAVLKVTVPAATLKPLALGQAERLRVGDPVVAIGNPFGLDRSVSAGIVSGLHRQITAPNGFTLSNALQTDAPVNHGNSGGPLLDASGRVVGVNAQIADSGVNANVGVAFAVALDGPVRKAIKELLAGRTVRHAWLGVSLDDIDAILATSGRVHATSGALVTGVVAGGPAEAAGVRGGSAIASIDGIDYCLGGDIVTAVAGTRVAGSGALQTEIDKHAPGTKVKLTVLREGGARASLTIVLGTQPTTIPPTTTGCG